jgi:uncharacterized protein (DUF2249 family)
MTDELPLDVRGLEPPEPLERVLEAAGRLKPGQRLRMIHHREPCLLYPLLAKRGFDHRVVLLSEDRCEVLIWRSGDDGAAPRD